LVALRIIQVETRGGIGKRCREELLRKKREDYHCDRKIHAEGVEGTRREDKSI